MRNLKCLMPLTLTVLAFLSAPSAARSKAATAAPRCGASHWLTVTFALLAIPADAAVARAEQLLRDAKDDLWAEAHLLRPLCILYAHVGRVAHARAAIDRSQSIFTGFGAIRALAESAVPAALTGLILGNPACAERQARQRYEAWRAMGQHGTYTVNLAGLLARALYERGASMRHSS